MSVNQSVNRIVMGSGIILAGTFVGMLFDILLKRVLTSHLSPADFGTYSLALTVISITGAVATLGLNEGVPRYIAFFRGSHEEQKIHELIISAIMMGLIAGLLAMLVSPILFEHLAGKGFDMQGRILAVIKILILAVPFTILLNLTVAIYRGFDRTSINMYFYNIIRPLSLLIFATTAVFLGASLHGVVFSDVLSMVLTFGIMSVYFLRRPPFKPELNLRFSEPTKQLIRYSFPLLISATLINLMTWTDTIILGYFKSTDVVGIYSAVTPLVGFLTMIINSMGFVYVPVASKLWGENKIQLIGPIYQIMTKWCFMLTFPIFALMFLYPEFILSKLYGADYASGAIVLRILSLGFVVNSYLGFRYQTIIASGDSSFLMRCSVASAGINALLNFMLVPQFGMIGAATASAVSFASIEVLMGFRLWKQQNMHPFTPMYRKLSVICASMVVSVLLVKNVLQLSGTGWECAAFVIAYFLIVRHANLLDEAEIEMIAEIWNTIRQYINIHISQAFRINAA
jgi:O-antigen/teichoic acid export membrane protein